MLDRYPGRRDGASGASWPAAGQSKADLVWKNLEAMATAAAAGFDGIMAIAIRDLTDGCSIAIRGDEVMPTASMIKIAVLVELYRQNRLRARCMQSTRRTWPPAAQSRADSPRA
jgi:hypothetical protein